MDTAMQDWDAFTKNVKIGDGVKQGQDNEIRKLKNPHLAYVEYVKLRNGDIKVVKLGNFYDLDDVVNKYGPRVSLEYFSSGAAGLWMAKSSIHPKPPNVINTYGVLLQEGMCYVPELFNSTITYMKACGKRLSNIIKDDAAHISHKIYI
jgi:hypothetical protein